MSPIPLVTITPLLAVLLLAACGDDEEEIAASERCLEEDFAAFTAGEIANDEISASLDIETASGTPGRVSPQEVRIQIGEAILPGGDPEEDDEYPVLLRLIDPDSPQDFARYIDELTIDDPLHLEIFDASDIGPGSQDLTSMDDFDCSIEEGTICMQVGFDTAGDGILFDDDDFVYNAAGGTLTIDGFVSGADRGFSVRWDADLGRNIMVQDDSSGDFEGCIRPDYEPRTDYWILE